MGESKKCISHYSENTIKKKLNFLSENQIFFIILQMKILVA